MKLTKSEVALKEELQKWRHSFFEYEPTSIENIYDKWMNQAFSLIPEPIQIEFFEKMDNWLFHLNSLLRGTQLQNEAFERIVQAAHSIDENVHNYIDMRNMQVGQLTFLAEQQAAKHRLYSLFQGGLTGSGQPIFLGSDFLSLLVINLRAVQIIAMSFGHDVRSPASLLETLKVFNVAIMPERMKMYGWEDLMEDLQKDEHSFYFNEQEHITDTSWLDEPFKQLLKMSAILMLTQKKESRLKWLSVAAGACVNYQTTRRVTNFAIKYYQFKHLLRKNDEI